MAYHYFLTEESKTGIAVYFDDEDGGVGICMACHPDAYYAWPMNYESITCGDCGAIYNDPSIKRHLEHLERSYYPKTSESLTGWVSAWTGIPMADLEITVGL